MTPEDEIRALIRQLEQEAFERRERRDEDLAQTSESIAGWRDNEPARALRGFLVDLSIFGSIVTGGAWLLSKALG